MRFSPDVTTWFDSSKIGVILYAGFYIGFNPLMIQQCKKEMKEGKKYERRKAWEGDLQEMKA